MNKIIKFDLGGVGIKKNRTTVNMVQPCDIEHDITDLDYFCEDNSVDEFFMSHTLEHIPTLNIKKFFNGLFKKLKSGGRVIVLQTDIGEVIKLWTQGKLSFRAMRTTVFTPEERLNVNPYHQHHNMWDAQTLMEDFQSCGFKSWSENHKPWIFDLNDTFLPQDCKKYHGIKIPNLFVIAEKP